jgi:hypothetical protein
MQWLVHFIVSKQCMFLIVILAATASDRRKDDYFRRRVAHKATRFFTAHNFESVRLRIRLKIVTRPEVPITLLQTLMVCPGAYSTILLVPGVRKLMNTLQLMTYKSYCVIWV